MVRRLAGFLSERTIQRLKALACALVGVAFSFCGAIWLFYLYGFSSKVDPSLDGLARGKLIAKKMLLDPNMLFATATGLGTLGGGCVFVAVAARELARSFGKGLRRDVVLERRAQ